MDVPIRPRTWRRGFLTTFVLAVALALVSAMASVAGAKPQVGPEVAAAGVGTKAALESANCGPDGKLAYPYQQRAPCTRPLKPGESNGGATTTGVDKDSIKVVLFMSTHEQQQTAWSMIGQSPPKDHATGQNAYTEDAYRDWSEVFAHSYNTWGRKIEFEVVTPTGADEAAQHADALTVAEKKPFAVMVQATGTGQVFANDLVAKKIVVFYGGITNAQAAKQAPYRWLFGTDSNAAAVNGVQFAARQLKGETAKWSGDFVDKQRVFGAVHPERDIDWEFFQSTAKEEGLELAPGTDLVYSVPLDTSTAPQVQQQEAPTFVAKLKNAGVTTVLLYAPFTMTGYLFKAADSLDYHPEWVFPGYGVSDIEITARDQQRFVSRPDEARVRHRHAAAVRERARGPAGGMVQLVLGSERRGVPGVRRRAPVHPVRGREPGRAEAHAEAVPAGTVRDARQRRRGNASGGVLHVRVRAHVRAPVRRVRDGRARLRGHVVEPDRHRQGKAPPRQRHRALPVHRRREAVLRRAVEEGRAHAVRQEQLDRAVRFASPVGRGTRLSV